jgi:glycosyltransferase involved in cell wall biosynthesis
MVATLFYPPNAYAAEWFIREVYSRIRDRVPDVRFVLVGAKPPRALRILARGDPRIELRGYIADLAEIYDSATVMVAPIRVGGGMRVKILDAMAAGVPIVATTVACEGIDELSERQVLVADEPDAFADSVCYLLADRQARLDLARAAFDLVQRRYDWNLMEDRVRLAYQRVGDSEPSGPMGRLIRARHSSDTL